jgi:hypothetical protein
MALRKVCGVVQTTVGTNLRPRIRTVREKHRETRAGSRLKNSASSNTNRARRVEPEC